MIKKHSKKILVITFVGVITYAFFTLALPRGLNNKENYNTVEGSLPGVKFFDQREQPVNLEDFAGQVVLVNLWATWCTPCVAELPSLDRLQAKLQTQNFKVIAISMDRTSLQKIAGFLKERDVEHLDLYWDKDRNIASKWSYAGIPVSFLLNKEGALIKRYDGPHTWDEGLVFEEVQHAAQ